ncbi:MAG: DNA gyrase inhibitor YacG [Planctomycetes bacterium]|nr:DNA gyrase inhibitor YacG [Planctomycetota bacterium]
MSDHAWFPFCSERCKTIDLARWFTNKYGFVEDLGRGHDMKTGGMEAIQDSDPPD